MRPPQRSLRRALAPAVVALHTLVLASCEPVQPLLVQPPTSSVGIDRGETLNGNHTRDLTLTAPDSSIAVGAQVQIVAMALDNHGAALPQVAVQWSITPTAVATISSAGLITGIAPGTATVSATADRITRTMTITVAADGATGGADTTATADGATSGGAADSTVAAPSGAGP
ncbi:MAG TPA: Ig-like domain-containing protein, partial [Gemmatimonadaceae bacterium]|nr:Ig-like domain-containing protein [Gemmatimonadaceae bacterium]